MKVFFKHMEYLKIQVQKIILWFFKINFVKNVVKNIHKWCKPCQIDNLKGNFTNWTSGNEKIDGFIQEMQLKINTHKDIVFEWIPYNQFSYIKEIRRGGFATVYSAIWKDGPLKYVN